MKDSTKIAYMLLKARLEIAISKRQIDEEGNVYFTYTTNELCRVLNCQNKSDSNQKSWNPLVYYYKSRWDLTNS